MAQTLNPRSLALVLTVALFAGTIDTGARAEAIDVSARRAADRRSFTDAEIADGFLRIAFGAEFRFSGTSDRIRKFDRPVRIFIDNRAVPDRRGQLEAIVADIGRRVRHLDIAVAPDRETANHEAILLRDRELLSTVATLYGAGRAKAIERALQPQCLSSLAKDEAFRILRARVLLVVDAGDFVFRDCAYEELLQSLGAINDTDIPWSMFNDDVRMGYFGLFDQHILNILYDPRIRAGMTVLEAKTLLPKIIPDVRAFVAKTNGLGDAPRGR